MRETLTGRIGHDVSRLFCSDQSLSRFSFCCGERRLIAVILYQVQVAVDHGPCATEITRICRRRRRLPRAALRQLRWRLLDGSIT